MVEGSQPAIKPEGGSGRLPPWFKIRFSGPGRLPEVRTLVGNSRLHTVCDSAACPNRSECWNRGTAAFMILGEVCTRDCGFCKVTHGIPAAPDVDESMRLARAVESLQLSYAVVTSVTRDDLPDGGASHFAAAVRAIKRTTPQCSVEVLIPDFQGSGEALGTVLDALPDVLNHNVETVPSLYPRVRPQADYAQSLELLSRAHERGFVTKSGLMVGLGERRSELLSTLRDLRGAGCGIVTIGQYLRPGRQHLAVEKYYRPDDFAELRSQALALGFLHVEAGPLVRSSYHADRTSFLITEGRRTAP